MRRQRRKKDAWGMNMRKYFLFGTVFLVSVVLLDYVKVRVNNKIEFVDKISQRKFTSYFLYPSEEARNKPTRHVALVKAHKCGSDLMGSILLRLAEEHSLEVLLPTETSSNLGFSPHGKFSVTRPSLSPTGLFDVMTLHTLYNYERWRPLMVEDFALIGMTRKPLSHIGSYFNYYSVGQLIAQYFNQTSLKDSFDFFLENAPKLATGGQWADKWKSVFVFKEALTNTMFFDYGGRNVEKKEEHINGIIQNFTVIMINEYFDESLVLIKNILKWDLKDILYKSKNIASRYSFNTSKDTERDHIREQLWRQHSPYDYMLYEKSLQKFKRQKEAITDFDQQVKEFKKMNRLANSWCWRKRGPSESDSPFLKLLTNFSANTKEPILVDKELCQRLQLDFLSYVSRHINIYNTRKKLLRENTTSQKT